MKQIYVTILSVSPKVAAVNDIVCLLTYKVATIHYTQYNGSVLSKRLTYINESLKNVL